MLKLKLIGQIVFLMGVNQMDSQLKIQSLLWNANKMHDYKWGKALCSFLHRFWFIVWKWLLCSQIWTNHCTTRYNHHFNAPQEWFYRQYCHFCKKDFWKDKTIMAVFSKLYWKFRVCFSTSVWAWLNLLVFYIYGCIHSTDAFANETALLRNHEIWVLLGVKMKITVFRFWNCVVW